MVGPYIKRVSFSKGSDKVELPDLFDIQLAFYKDFF